MPLRKEQGDLNLTFGDLVRLFRVVRKLSQRELGELAAVHYMRVFRIEHGAAPKDDEARRLCEALGLPLSTVRSRRRR